MTQQAQGMQDSGMVVGWKAICEALGGVSRQTAMRWARNFGLPIHRPAGAPVMFLADRDKWIRSGQGHRQRVNPIKRRLKFRVRSRLKR